MLIADISWMIWALAIPLAGALLCLLVPRHCSAIGLTAAAATLVTTGGLVTRIALTGPGHHRVAGWGAPLGIELAVDGLSALMLAMTAVVGITVGVYARAYLAPTPDKERGFWPLFLLLWTSLNALFQTQDVFNLYVTLELLGLSAVALIALSGTGPAFTGAMRYLLVSLFGSLAFLVGVALLYHLYGTLDLQLLASRSVGDRAIAVPLAAMIAGMLLKTGLFPFHVWLPPAHGSARAPVSALLSALVVKASFYVLLRLWAAFRPEGPGIAEMLGTLGAIAVFWGSLQALRQRRLKLLVAYSTTAQLGYLFLAFPLAAGAPGSSWSGAVYLAVAHGFAKTAMFLAAGSIMTEQGHDRIDELDQVVERMPLTLAAFALAGISLAGLPPSGGFVGKWLLLESALGQNQWHWALVIIVGGILTAGYVFRVLGYAFTDSARNREKHTIPPVMEWSALAIALVAVSLGFLAPWALPLLEDFLP